MGAIHNARRGVTTRYTQKELGMTTMDRIGRKATRDVEQPTETAAVVWICSECFDAYDAVTADGTCPNPGHAPVRLYPSRVRSTPTAGLATEPDRLALRGDRVTRLQARSKAA